MSRALIDVLFEPEPFGPYALRTARKSIGLSQVQLGEALGVPVNTIARWERGDLPIRHPKMLALAIDAITFRAGQNDC